MPACQCCHLVYPKGLLISWGLGYLFWALACNPLWCKILDWDRGLVKLDADLTTFFLNSMRKVQGSDRNLPSLEFKQHISSLSLGTKHSSTALGRAPGIYICVYTHIYIYVGGSCWQWQQFFVIWLLLNRIKFLIPLAILYTNPVTTRVVEMHQKGRHCIHSVRKVTESTREEITCWFFCLPAQSEVIIF